MTTGKGVTIHTIDCDTLGSFADEPERWLDVAWSSDETSWTHWSDQRHDRQRTGQSRQFDDDNRQTGRQYHNLKITNRSTDFFEILVDIEVGDVKHLSTIIAALRATPVINSVERARGCRSADALGRGLKPPLGQAVIVLSALGGDG